MFYDCPMSDESQRWDLEIMFPSIESDPFEKHWRSLNGHLKQLKSFFDPMPPRDKASFDRLVGLVNDWGEAFEKISVYLSLRIEGNTTDAKAQAKDSELEYFAVERELLEPKIVDWLSEVNQTVVPLGEYSFYVEDAKFRKRYMLSPAEEALASQLSPTSSTGWVKLFTNITSQLEGEVGGEKFPLPAISNFLMSPEESVRKEAFCAREKALKSVQNSLASALNGYKGTRIVLNKRRGWKDNLEPALRTHRISAETLSAMQTAMVGSFPDFRRYYLAKAKLLGKAKLDWWDISAPVGQFESKWDWESGKAFILENLKEKLPKAAELAERAFDERWMDIYPRSGKSGGAFCSPIGGGNSRILLNFADSFEWVTVTAHELGHAYHNLCTKDVPYVLRQDPMTLAETASITNETVLIEKAFEVLPKSDVLGILEYNLQNAAQVIVDIHSRFLFESSFYENRAKRDLSADEMCQLMVDAQRQTYGDAIATPSPYQWAFKPHYYGADFYNFPYAFGMLFSLAVYKRLESEGEAFRPVYDELLRVSGMGMAEDVADRFGFDIRQASFWQEGISVIKSQIDRFVEIADNA